MEKAITKKVDYSILSNKKCNICNRPLKQNVVARNKSINLCYVCFKLSKGNNFFCEHGEKKYYYDMHVHNCRKFGGKITFLKSIKK